MPRTEYSFSFRSIWSSISSQLHSNQSTTTVEPTRNSPPLETTSPFPSSSASSTTTTITDSTTPFEFYDPRGLSNKVRNTRSRSNTPQANTSNSNGASLSRESSLSAGGHNKLASSPGGTFDENGDLRMRLGSEEPPTLLNSSLPIKVPSQPSPSLPPSPTPLARSPPSGIPLNFGRPSSNLQRQPSIKANAAFSRLRIGSFGNPNPSSSSPNSNSEETNTRTLSPDSGSRDSSPRPQHERNNSAPPASSNQMGMSPAASFLSSFGGGGTPSPPTPQYSTTTTTNNYARRVGGRGGGVTSTSFGLLPLKGDQEGFVLPRFTLVEGESEEEEEVGEWRLGKELGSGGMGLVRECIWRGGINDEKKKKKKRKKLAVKIVRKDLFNGNGSAGGNGSVVDAFGGGAASQGRPLPGSRSSSFQHPTSNSNSNSNMGLGLRNPSKDRLLGGGGGGSPGFLERNRSTSSPIQPPSNLFPPNSSSSSTTSNGGSLSPIEQSPLPSPGLDSDNHHHQREREEEVKEPPSLLEALLQRELSLWSQISSPRPSHPNLVPLLGMTETLDFTYVFMPLCDGGTLLSYLNSDPLERDVPPVDVEAEEEEDVAVETEGEESSSKSRSRSRSKGRGLRGRNTLPRVRPRGSLPFASSISPSAASGSGTSISTSRRTSSRFLSPPPKPQEKALGLEQAGRVFEDIVQGLRWLHEEKRVVHKDFKLENLLASWEEEEEVTSEEEEEGAEMEMEMESERGRAAAVGRKKKKKLLRRVWKVADFGLSEIIPPPLQAQSTTNLNRKNKTLQVSGVQPLSSLSRVSSLSRPHGPHQNNNSSSSLSHSVGPSHTKPHHSQSLLLPRTQPTPPSPDLSTHLHPIGSLPYSSPESLKSPIPILDPSVDIWALGCVLYAIVEGKLPIWDEWEFRLRTRLVKGEWEIPDNLKGGDDGDGEKGMVLEVLKGCLERDVRERWDIGRIAKCDWLRFCRERREERKQDKKKKKNKLSVQPQSQTQPQFDVDMQPLDSPNSISLGSPPARGRTTQRPLPPPILSSFSSTASSSAASTSTSRSSSRSLSRPNRPSPVSHESPLPSTMRRPSRSTSRSSAYAHQGVDSMTKQEELRERGRSQRRLRWDEEKETSRVRRRSESRDAFEGVMEETLGGGGGQRRGRSSSRGSNQTGASGGKSRDRGDTGERLETVGEPY
ncbi:hypothetical protein JCM5353_003042 [Sporobolomyces roseus]